MKNNKFKLTSKMLKNTLTFSAVLLTLTSSVLPLAAQAVESNEKVTAVDNSEVSAVETQSDTVDKKQNTEQLDDVTVNEQTDANSVIEVSNWTEFHRAITNTNAEEIKLTSNIIVGNDLTVVGTKKTINANGYTLDMNNKNIYGLENGVYKLSNAILENTTAKGGPFSSDRGYLSKSEITYSNIKQSGLGFLDIQNGTLFLEGNIDSVVPSNGRNSIYANSLYIKENANVKMINNASAPSTGINNINAAIALAFGSYGVLEVEKNATFDLTSSKMGSIKTASANSVINFNGEVKINSDAYIAIEMNKDTVLNLNSKTIIKTIGHAIEGQDARIELLKNADVDLQSYNNPYNYYGVITIGGLTANNGSTLKLEGEDSRNSILTITRSNGLKISSLANVDIKAIGTASALGAKYSPSLNMFLPFAIDSEQGIQTWATGKTENSDASKFYNGLITTSFTLNNNVPGSEANNRNSQQNLTSNNTTFSREFVALSTGRIATGKFTTNPNYKEPILEAPERIEIEKGSSFDPLKVSGLKATDYQGNDITSSITSSGVVDTNKPGEYTVVYSVTDSTGKTVTKTMIVVVKDTATIKQTTINGLTTDSTQAVGTAEPNSTIVIKVDDKEIGRGTVGSDGKYSITIPKQTAGAKVTATATASGKESSATTTVTQGNIKQTTINGLTTDSTQAVGTAEPNSTIVIKVDGKEIATGKVGSDGKYSITIPKQTSGTKVTATATASGKESSATTTVTQGTPQLQAPVINDYYTTDAYATGTVEGDVKQVAIFVNGLQKRTAAVVNGKFQIYTGDLDLKVAGNKFEIAAISGSTVGPKTEATVKERVQLVAPVINDYYTTDAYATGTVAGDVKQVAIFVNGVQKRTAAVVNGKFQIYTGDLDLKVAGNKFEIAAISGSIVGPKTEATVKERVQLVAPVINPYYTTDAYAAGTVAGDVKQVAIFVNGVQKRTAAVVNGKFQIYTGDLDLKIAGNKFEIAAISGTIVGPKTQGTVLEKGSYDLGANEYTVTKDSAVTGKKGAGISTVKLYVDGVLVRQNSSTSGNYEIYAADKITKDTKKVEIVGYAANGIERNRVTVKVTVPKVDPIKVTPNEYVLKSDNVTGKITGENSKAILVVDGVEERRGSVSSDGTFTIYAKDKITSTNQKVEIIGEAKDGSRVTAAVVVK